MKTKIFIDGSEGTTGLRIHERFAGRDDVELLPIASELRKDAGERKRLINESDITFLCLPDVAARESVSLIENENVRIIDTSTAHRTEEGWAYGFPELSGEFRDKISKGKRIAVPGCYATGFISLVYPLIQSGILPKDYPVATFAMSGYSGAGRKAIAVYESKDRAPEFDAPREYALSQQHKHLKEMTKITGLQRTPLFSPMVCDYYSGMIVTLPLYTDLLNGTDSPLDYCSLTGCPARIDTYPQQSRTKRRDATGIAPTNAGKPGRVESQYSRVTHGNDANPESGFATAARCHA